MVWTPETTPHARIRASQPFSLHHGLVRRYWSGGPDELNAAPLNRICTLARKMGLGRIVVEDALRRPDVIAEIERLERIVGTAGPVTASAISFFRRGRRTSRAGAVDVAGPFGQAVVVTYPGRDGPRSFVHEAIMEQPCAGAGGGPLLNNYVPTAQTFTVRADGGEHDITGAYFCQDNGFSVSRAEAALRITLRALGRAPASPIGGRPIPDGHEAAALARGLDEAGFNVAAYDLTRTGRGKAAAAWVQEAWTTVTSFLESGNPALLVIGREGGRQHALPVLGYTVNSDEWHPGAGVAYGVVPKPFHSSSSWVDHLIVQDPMMGPYLCLSRAWFGEAAGKADAMMPRYVIAPLPPGVRTSPAVAERIAGAAIERWIDALTLAGYGQGRWWQYLSRNRAHVVMRTTLVGRQDYGFHLRRFCKPRGREEWNRQVEDYLLKLPETFWLCEVSLPQIYVGNRAKLGEIVVSADTPDRVGGNDSGLAFRFPSLLGWRSNGDLFSIAEVSVAGHVPLLAPARHGNDW